MPSKLPTIQMPVAEPEHPPAPKVDRIDDIIGELDDKNDHECDDGELVQIDPRKKFEEDEVFNAPSKKEDPPANEEKEELTSEIGEPPVKSTGRRKYQRKGEMTQKQKEHLERIRAKALENKKKRREEQEAVEKEKSKALEEKREQKRLEEEQKKQEKEIERQAKEAQRLAEAMAANAYSKQDLENAMITAIHRYDTHRKAQKAEKKKKQAEEAHQANQTRLIQQAINPNPPVDPWRKYFS